MPNRTVKHNAGDYTRTDGARSVNVRYFDHLRGWIAAAQWDRNLMTDPVDTMREAVKNADYMLDT